MLPTPILDSIDQMTSSQILTGTLGKEIGFFDIILFIILTFFLFSNVLEYHKEPKSDESHVPIINFFLGKK